MLSIQLEKLYTFQELEIREAKLNSILNNYPEKKILVELKKTIQKIDDSLDHKLKELSQLKKELYRLELYSQEINNEIKLLDERIYGGEVKTVKELEKLQEKQNALQKKASQVDDTALSVMEKIDEIENYLSSNKKDISKMKAEFDSKRLKTREELDKINNELDSIVSDKEELIKQIASDLLKKYEKVKKLKDPPMSRVIDGKCSGCRMDVPIMVAQEVNRHERLIYCESCGRILT
jgi:predicted  nucleic acid-binding Zn-ribbon protein